ncbi:ArsR/SmtB family transcription factor [Agrobacterium vitis]|uniref:ArsR/SmtB family transcription factor n=1 Tax=Agrobacterium vitis TaxID=373 RepID=UPI0012E99012|nr:helix-turn-helix domain-containing protein [Agrobacterium vitis]MUZ65637.1 helix-turn-helix domain-containing protein [Agrobacterium vitis]
MRDYPHPKCEDLDLARVLYALSDPLRLGIVRQLAVEGATPCGAICSNRPKSSMSHHFRTLRDAGIIWTVVEGTVHLNNLRRDDLERRFPGLLQVILQEDTTQPRAD